MNGTSISANELKTKGVAILDKATENGIEAVITVRGKGKYVVLPITTYNYLRECELETALREAQADIAAGRFNNESVAEHVRRITRA